MYTSGHPGMVLAPLLVDSTRQEGCMRPGDQKSVTIVVAGSTTRPIRSSRWAGVAFLVALAAATVSGCVFAPPRGPEYERRVYGPQPYYYGGQRYYRGNPGDAGGDYCNREGCFHREPSW